MINIRSHVNVSLTAYCRAVSYIYFGIMSLILAFSTYPMATVPLYILGASLSLIILEHESYDIRSCLVLTLVTCNLYFTGRPTFAYSQFGWYYAFLISLYDLFLFGIIISFFYYRRRPTPKLVEYNHKKITIFFAISFTTIFICIFIIRHLFAVTGAEGSFTNLVYQSLITRSNITILGYSALLQLFLILSMFGTAVSFLLWKIFNSRISLVAWILLLAYSSLTLGSRGIVVIPLIQLMIALSLLMPNPKKLLIVVIPILIGLYSFSMWFASAREGLDETKSDYSIFDRFDAYDNWLQSLNKNGIIIKPGDSFIAAPLQLLPRKLFPNKPYYFSTEMTRINRVEAFNRGVNLDYGGLAESVYNFGLLGPLLFGIFIGWISRHIEKFRRAALVNNSPVDAFIYSQGVMIPSFFIFVGWINTSLIFVVIGFIFNTIILQKLTNLSIIKRGSK